jgi:hypothetical protein
MYLNYRYLVTVFHKHSFPLRERLGTLTRLNSERCMKKGLALVAQFLGFNGNKFINLCKREMSKIINPIETGGAVADHFNYLTRKKLGLEIFLSHLKKNP